MEWVVECENLTKRFRDKIAVDLVSLQVARGEVFGLIGPDGAGKTTVLRMLAGILEPTAGRATVLGRDVRCAGAALYTCIGYMPQRFSLYGDLTVAENIEFVADLHQVPLAERSARMEQLLHACRMSAFRDRLARDLSGGMKQKLALTCALIHAPEILFLDEPTTGVDPVSRREFWDLLQGLVARGMTLVVSTPFMDEADRCDRIAFLHYGRLLTVGTPAAIAAQAGGGHPKPLEDAFIALAGEPSHACR